MAIGLLCKAISIACERDGYWIALQGNLKKIACERDGYWIALQGNLLANAMAIGLLCKAILNQ